MFQWLDPELAGATSVLDLGAGKFDKLGRAPATARKVGIEIWPGCIEARDTTNIYEIIHGDMREWMVLAPPDVDDVALLLDVLEHIPKPDGHRLVTGLQTRFRKIVVFTPMGFMPQTEDVWGMGNPNQIHVSGWTVADLTGHDFEIVAAEPDYHQEGNGKPRGGAIFAVWERP
jgi:hypothetical protein